MFAVVISEKGGAERREVFDRPEISVGRVQGNDLMLPKGNVSKRHARLLFRDNRFIVTDLNSTNGTYVNRRRISQATIVREGDRVYIGDFVLRIELPDSESDEAPSSSEEVSVSAPAPAGAVEPVQPSFASIPDAEPPDHHTRRPVPPPAPSAAPPAPSVPPPLPPPPRPSAPVHTSQAPPVAASAPPPVTSEPPEQSSSSDRVSSRAREFQLEPHVAVHRQGVRALVGRVTELLSAVRLAQPVDESARQRVERAVVEQLGALRGEGAVGAEADEDRVLSDARAELCALGPLGPLLNDDDVTEVSVTGFAHVAADSSTGWRIVEPPFASEESLERVVTRLCRLAGKEPTADEAVVERILPGAVRMRAVRGSIAGGRSLLSLRKARRVTSVADDLVRRGTLSRHMATFLRHATAGGANILVVGTREARAADLLNALANLSDAYWLCVAESELLSGDARVTRLMLESNDPNARRVIGAASVLGNARLLVENAQNQVATAVIENIAAGARGCVVSTQAGNLEQALERLMASFMSSTGAAREAARHQVVGSFDLLVEIAQLRDQRYRVLRIAEPAGLSADGFDLDDIFAFSFQRTAAGGAVEGTFASTGTVPKLAEDLGARGITMEPSLFSRNGR
ncbi:MAG: Flp pilus assembly complex ATPase component TadA [Polyangiaceae bacterium]|nr:Flp pilus assembly complex ATPase component TadA [Polyangiaceae bacterium]